MSRKHAQVFMTLCLDRSPDASVLEGSQSPAPVPEAFGHGHPGEAEMCETRVSSRTGTMPNRVAAGNSQVVSANLDGATAFPDTARC
jgi:hypothetical protein